MGLINEKNYNIYDYKPEMIDKIIFEKHKEYNEKAQCIQTNCPACNSKTYEFAFEKFGFHYVQCKSCMSLYIQNRLTQLEHKQYEIDLKNKIYSTEDYENYLDVLSNKSSFELELIFSRFFNKNEPMKVLYLGQKQKVYENLFKAFNVELYSKNLTRDNFDLVILDHVIERTSPLDNLMENISCSLSKDAYLFVNIRVGSGIDILTLWEDCKAFPLEHLNLLSIDGIKILLDKFKFEIKELNTPGVLDVDNILENNSDNIPRFLRYLSASKNQVALDEFQTFVQKNLLSSFATIVGKKV